MQKVWQLLACLVIAVGFAIPQLYAQQTTLLPKPPVCVSDTVHALTGPATARLNALCADVLRQTGTQMSIVTMPSTGGMAEPIYARQLAHAWRLGNHSAGRGVMILASTIDCHWALLATPALAGVLPQSRLDAIGQRMQLYFRVAQNDEGVTLGAQEVASLLAENAGVTLDVKPVALPPVGRPPRLLGRKQAAVTGGALLLLLILVWRLRLPQSWLSARHPTTQTGSSRR